MSDKITIILQYVAVAATVLLYSGVAVGQDDGTPNFTFNAYGTIGVTHTNEDRAEFIPELFDPEGVGSSGDWSAEVDSRLGLQLTANLTSRLSAVVQVVAEQRYDDTWKPTLEWANLKYQITPDLYVRAGRLVLPSFMASDYRKVSYALPWVRTPLEVYRLLPVTNTNGLEANYRFNVGDFSNTVRIVYGIRKNGVSPRDGGEVKARDSWVITDTLEYDDLTLFAGFSSFRLTLEALNPFFDAFRQFGPQGEAIADRNNLDHKRFNIVNVGARYDPGGWFLMGEWSRTDTTSFIGSSENWYVSGGYRIGSFTPYVTYANIEPRSSTSVPGLSVAGLPPPVAAAAQGLNAALNSILNGANADQNTLTLGLRWDFYRNVALKLQYDYTDLGPGSAGILSYPEPGFNPGGSLSIFSANIDFVY